MIEILNENDILKIKNKELKEYLYKSFRRLPKDFLYPDYGFFVVIDSFDEINKNTIILSDYKLNGFNAGMVDRINMVEFDGEIVEILVFIDTDVNVSFVMFKSILDIEIIKIPKKELSLLYLPGKSLAVSCRPICRNGIRAGSMDAGS